MKEKRKASRIQILDSFSVYLVLPQLGPYRNKIYDLSEVGIGFESIEEPTPFEVGNELLVHFYLNQTLHFPLTIKIARVAKKGDVLNVGAEFLNKDKKSLEALRYFTQVLSCLEGIAEIGNS